MTIIALIGRQRSRADIICTLGVESSSEGGETSLGVKVKGHDLICKLCQHVTAVVQSGRLSSFSPFYTTHNRSNIAWPRVRPSVCPSVRRVFGVQKHRAMHDLVHTTTGCLSAGRQGVARFLYKPTWICSVTLQVVGRRAVSLRGKTASRGPSAIDNGHSAFFVHCNYHFNVSFSPSCPISNYQLFLRGHAPGSFVGTACLAAERNQRPDSGPCSLNNKT